MQTLNKMKEKLEKETSEHKQVKQQVADLTAQLHELSRVRAGATGWVFYFWAAAEASLTLEPLTLGRQLLPGDISLCDLSQWL